MHLFDLLPLEIIYEILYKCSYQDIKLFDASYFPRDEYFWKEKARRSTTPIKDFMKVLASDDMFEAVKGFIDSGIIDPTFNHNMPIMVAITSQRLDIVEFLMSIPSVIEHITKSAHNDRRHPLRLAASIGNLEIVKFLSSFDQLVPYMLSAFNGAQGNNHSEITDYLYSFRYVSIHYHMIIEPSGHKRYKNAVCLTLEEYIEFTQIRNIHVHNLRGDQYPPSKWDYRRAIIQEQADIQNELFGQREPTEEE